MTSLPAPTQTLMYQEAQESAERVAEQLRANQAAVAALAQELRRQPPRFVVTSARGSSDHAATFAKYVFETQLGYATSSASPSVSSVYAAPQKLDGALYLAISQSGKSPDLLRQARAAREAGARVVARGLGLAAAQEAALKLKETCGLHAEAFSAAEVKHGPMALVEAGFPVLFFTQDDDTLATTLALAEEFHNRGARVWTAASQHGAPNALPVAPIGHPICAPIVTIGSFYRAANALALRRGRNPDVPPHLRKVTETV